MNPPQPPPVSLDLDEHQTLFQWGMCSSIRLPATAAAVCAYTLALFHTLCDRGWNHSEAFQYSLAVESALMIAIKYSMPHVADHSRVTIDRAISDTAIEIRITHMGKPVLFSPVVWFAAHYPIIDAYPGPATIYARAVLLLTGGKPSYSSDGNLVILYRKRAA